MPYIINRSDGSILLTLQDGTVDTSLSLGLVGKNYTGYGEIQNENFVYLLENFAGPNPPARPMKGQTWYDSENQLLNFYTGNEWVPVGAAQSSDTPPIGVPGAFWFNTITQQLYIFVNQVVGWQLIGPESIPNFKKTRAEARVLKDIENIDHAALVMVVDGEDLAICVTENFVINTIDGFATLIKGINISGKAVINGNVVGNSSTSTKLETARGINGVAFDGSKNITIKASTTNPLQRGTYLTGSNFDGSLAVTWSVDATSNNIIGKVVVRDGSGNFSANDITANRFIGKLIGNVDIDEGVSYFNKIVCDDIEPRRFRGTAVAANRLSPGCFINEVFFDGSQNVTIPTAANTLTGNRLASNVLESSLNVVGVLNSLNVRDTGIVVGVAESFKLFVDNSRSIIEELSGQGLSFTIRDQIGVGLKSSLRFLPSTLTLGNPSFTADFNNSVDLGLPQTRFANVYAGFFQGEATSAQYADLAEKYVADSDYEPGTVLEFGGSEEVSLASEGSTKVAGVVSTNPAYLMNSDCEGKFVAVVALQGRVPCKVVGPVSKGDMLVSAGGGFAKVEKIPAIGSVIGKSLVDFSGDNGVIEIAVGRL